MTALSLILSLGIAVFHVAGLSGKGLAQEKTADKATDKGQDNRAEAVKKFLEGKRLEDSGNFSGAVAGYRSGIEIDPTSARLRIALGSLYHRNRTTLRRKTRH